MEAFARERIEEPGRVPDQEPARPGASGHATAQRRRAGELVAAFGVTPRGGSSAAGGTAATTGIRDGRRAVPGEPRTPRGPEHDPDVDAPAGNRGDPDVAAVESPGRRASGDRVRPRDRRGGTSDPTRSGSRVGRATPAARATTECAPSAPTTTAAPERPGPVGPRVVRTGRPSSSSTASTATPRRIVAPASRGERLERRVEPRPVEPDGRRPAVLRAVGQPHHRAARRLEAHRRDRPRDSASSASRDAQPRAAPRPSAGEREHATGPPPPGRWPLQDRDLDAARARARPRGRSPPAHRRRSRRRPLRAGFTAHADAPTCGPSADAAVAVSTTR